MGFASADLLLDFICMFFHHGSVSIFLFAHNNIYMDFSLGSIVNFLKSYLLFHFALAIVFKNIGLYDI